MNCRFFLFLLFLPALCLANTFQNNLPPRLEWNGNFGYCGETSLISAGLYYGQYVSQYKVRAIASKNTPQYFKKSQLLLGVNDHYAASQMHLNSTEWNTDSEKNTPQFLAWVKKNVLLGYPVAIGVYTNEYLFYGIKNPYDGDADYDHIVLVTGISSNHSFSNSNYYGNDKIIFSDHGLWDDDCSKPPYIFQYSFNGFQANRKQANAKNGTIYSLANNGSNYGLAVTGVMDKNGDTLPVRIDTNVNYEKPAIVNGSSIPPDPMLLQLNVTVSNLEPHVQYQLYRYDNFADVPDSNFNAKASQAAQSWHIQITSGNTFVMTQEIMSDEIAVYRCVKSSAP